jgi:hypothetical protein
MTMRKEIGSATIESSTPAKTAVEEEWFDLMPVEKKLIGYSLGLGVSLLIIFVFVFGVYHH